MATVRRFHSRPDAKRYVYNCLAESLSSDLDTGAEYIFDDQFSELDRTRVERAVRQVVGELSRKAEPRGRGKH